VTHSSTIPDNHFKQVCQFGFVHSQCRCPSPEKQEVAVECNRVREHAPSSPLGSMVSLKHSSPDLMAAGLLGANLMLSYDSPNALARAATHLMNCEHNHNFAVLRDNQPMPALLTSKNGIDCLRLASLMF